MTATRVPGSSAGARASAPPEDAVREALREGHRREALTLLMDWLGERVYRFCRSMVRDIHLAADVQQNVFVSAYESLAGQPEVASFEGWLFGIARNRCLDALKTRRRWFGRFRLGTTAADEEDPGPAVDQRLAGGERNLALLDCLAGLKSAVRMAVVMRFQENLSFEQMSRICGERATTLQARVARALPGLRQCLEAKGWENP